MIKSLIKTATMLLFISKSELDEAKKRFPDFSEKFIYVPFCVDTKFWSPESSKVKQKISCLLEMIQIEISIFYWI